MSLSYTCTQCTHPFAYLTQLKAALLLADQGSPSLPSLLSSAALDEIARLPRDCAVHGAPLTESSHAEVTEVLMQCYLRLAGRAGDGEEDETGARKARAVWGEWWTEV
ncbi:MAG: hypothetical protein MMC23_004300 [Stictis urceolatum]|nr:hypothetical protein [Stictis urceolata]